MLLRAFPDVVPGGERHVARVDVSLDGGANWSQAELLEDLGHAAAEVLALLAGAPAANERAYAALARPHT